MGAEELNRLRWQCRRGLLELDLVLERFLERHGERLQGEHLASFKTLLEYADNDLLDLIRARDLVEHMCSARLFESEIKLELFTATLPRSG
jgi:antitoxin CptB